MKRKILQHKLLLSKIIFSFYNLLIIVILNFFFSPKLAGQLLFIQGLLFIASALSRLGSDFYWVSSENHKIVVSKNEIFLLLTSSIVFAYFLYFFISKYYESSIVWVFAAIILLNIINFLGRVFQKEETHVTSLFMFLLAPNFFVLPLMWFYPTMNIFILFSISMSIVIVAVVLTQKVKFHVEIKSNSFFQRLHYLPITIYGIINQNLISTIGGLVNREEQIALLMLFQRLTGIVLWPQTFHMQKDINKINSSLANETVFKNYLISYIKNNIKEVAIYSTFAIVISMAVLYESEKFNFYTISASILILFASIINVFLGYLQVQIGHSQKGFVSIAVLLFSLTLVILLANLFNYPYIILALSYLFFHLINHISNYYILSTWIKK